MFQPSMNISLFLVIMVKPSVEPPGSRRRLVNTDYQSVSMLYKPFDNDSVKEAGGQLYRYVRGPTCGVIEGCGLQRIVRNHPP